MSNEISPDSYNILVSGRTAGKTFQHCFMLLEMLRCKDDAIYIINADAYAMSSTDENGRRITYFTDGEFNFLKEVKTPEDIFYLIREITDGEKDNGV